MTLLCSEKQRSGSILTETDNKIIWKKNPVLVTAQILVCTVSLHLRAKGKSCQMPLRSDSAQCRNLSDRIPSAGTQCGANWQLHRKLGEAKQQADEKVGVLLGDDWGPYIQLVVNIGSIPQQSVHRLGVSILGRNSESCAAILKESKLQMWLFLVVSISFFLLHESQREMVTFSSTARRQVKGATVPCRRTFVWNSVEAPNSKRSFTTSLWPCWEAKKRAVEPVWREWQK